MKPKIILINPWIYDFSAVNLWARPLGLLMVAEYMSRFGADLKLIDCTEVSKTTKKYGTGKYPRQIIEKPEVLRTVPRRYARYGMSSDEFKERLRGVLPCDVIFVTSIMSYWYPGVCRAVETVRSLCPETPVILGGIYATLFYDHAVNNSGADYVYRGHIGEDIENVLVDYGLSLNRQSRGRPYYKLNLYPSYPFAPVLTSSGCPYRCPYCASSALFEGFVQRGPDGVVNEIEEFYKSGVTDFAFYDDALLVNSDTHLKMILKEIIKKGLRPRFHCPNGIHARFLDDETAFLMKQTGFTTLRISLETVNAERQAGTGGKVTSDILRSAVRSLMKHGFTKEQTGVYLMYGLPGQSLQEVREGVDFLKGLGVRIHLTEFSPIPGTSCWEELKDKGTIADDIDPLLTNNSVFTELFAGYDPDDLKKLKQEVREYNAVY